MCDAHLVTDASMTSDEAPWDLVPSEPEEVKKETQVKENKSPGDSPKESAPEKSDKAPDEPLKEKDSGAKKESEEKEDKGEMEEDKDQEEDKDKGDVEEADFGDAEVVIATDGEEGGLNNMRGLSKALDAVEATEDEHAPAAITPLKAKAKTNALTSTPSLTPTSQSVTSTSAPAKRVTRIPISIVPKRDLLKKKLGNGDNTDTDVMPPPPLVSPLRTAKAKPRARSMKRGRSRTPKVADVEPEKPTEERSRSTRVTKVRAPEFTTVPIQPIKQKTSKEIFLEEMVFHYRAHNKLHSAADFNLLISCYLYKPSDKYPVSSLNHLSAAVLKQDSSEEHRFWCYSCDLGGSSAGKRMHSSWGTPEELLHHWWATHATTEDWQFVHKARELKITIDDIVYYLFWMDFSKFPLPNWHLGLVSLPKRIPTLSGDRAHNARIFEAPYHCSSTPSWHRSEVTMANYRSKEQLGCNDANENDKQEEDKCFTTFGWESPLKLFLSQCEREVNVLTRPFDCVSDYSRSRSKMHLEQYERRYPLTDFLLTTHC